jgi:hypothetical protein
MAPDLDPILGELVMDALCAVGLAATPKGWMSVKLPKAEVAKRWWHFRFVPTRDIRGI